MDRLLIPAPNARQRLFLQDKHRYIAFGGARGGGKSWAVRVKAVLLAYRFPGIRIIIVRRTYQELKSNHIEPLQALLGGSVRYRDVHHEFIFPNGSKIELRQTQNEKDITKFQGTEADVLFIDEATQLTELQYDKIKAIVRGVNDFPKRIYLTCNPGGVGHAWVKRLFIDRKYIRVGENGEDYSFIKSLVTDNKALMQSDPEYVLQLQALPPKLRQAWLEGDWDIFEGQYFEEFRVEPDRAECLKHGLTPEAARRERRWVHVIEPFKVPREWKVYRSFDWGYAKPFSCDWWAVDYDGRAYLIKQWYGCNGVPNEGLKLDPDEVMRQIAAMERQSPELRGRQIFGVADPAIFKADGGETIAEVADRHRVFFQPGDNSRVQGWMQVHRRLKFDAEGLPMIYFFDTCRDAIRTLPLLQYDERKVEDLDTEGEDHFADSMRYFCMFRPIGPTRTPEEIERGDDPLDLWRSL